MAEFIPEDLIAQDALIQMRWRLHAYALPLKNRHLRALSATGVTLGLQSWARQHIEWTLAQGAVDHPCGVLVIRVDAQGRAIMEVEEYIPLDATNLVDLQARVAHNDALAVESELLWVVCDDALVACTSQQKPLSGANSLVADLAHTLKREVRYVCDPAQITALLDTADEVFLVSDEHGVVPASDACGEVAGRFAELYDRLIEATKADDFDRANLGLR